MFYSIDGKSETKKALPEPLPIIRQMLRATLNNILIIFLNFSKNVSSLFLGLNFG